MDTPLSHSCTCGAGTSAAVTQAHPQHPQMKIRPPAVAAGPVPVSDDVAAARAVQHLTGCLMQADMDSSQLHHQPTGQQRQVKVNHNVCLTRSDHHLSSCELPDWRTCCCCCCCGAGVGTAAAVICFDLLQVSDGHITKPDSQGGDALGLAWVVDCE